jgi:hypothetical protein
MNAETWFKIWSSRESNIFQNLHTWNDYPQWKLKTVVENLCCGGAASSEFEVKHHHFLFVKIQV